MDHPAKLTVALCILLSGAAHAGYAQLAPPAGASTSAGQLMYKAAANEAWVSNTVRTTASLNVGGRAVAVPVAMRMAANAPRFLAAGAFAHPAVIAGTVLAPLVISWALSKGFSVGVDPADGQRKWIETEKKYEQSCVISSAQRTQWNNCVASSGYHTNGSTTTAETQYLENGCRLGYHWTTVAYPPGGFTGCLTVQKTTIETAQSHPATRSDFENKLSGAPINPAWPAEIGLPTSVDLPLINPSPSLAPQPLFVPTGNPRLNPNYNPSAPAVGDNLPYLSPGVKVVPAPTADNPWRVDLQPVDRPVASPNPGDEANPNPGPNPDPVQDPNADTDKPKPEEQKGLCEQYPDIVACANLGKPGEAKPVADEKKSLSITPESGFGPSSGSCPAPRTVQVSGLSLSMPFDLLCQFASGIKPVIVGLAWLSAAFTFMGIGRRA